MNLYSPVISGSLTVTGSTSFIGNVTMTGTVSATASNASLLDGTGSVGFTTTGSFTTMSGSVSSRVSQIENVYATTGSNSFRATQSITGSLTVTGQIIAQTLNVQQVTSSIVYSSGSNVFGCDINSRQTFTGSFYQTGSVASFSSCVGVGIITPTSVGGNTIMLHDSTTPRIRLTNNITGTTSTDGGELSLFACDFNIENRETSGAMNLYTNGSLRLKITNDGKVGIATTTTPNDQLVIGEDLGGFGSGYNALTIGCSTKRTGIFIGQCPQNNVHLVWTCSSVVANAYAQLTTYNYCNALYIDASKVILQNNNITGRVGIGTDTPTSKLVVQDSNPANCFCSIAVFGNSTPAPRIHIKDEDGTLENPAGLYSDTGYGTGIYNLGTGINSGVKIFTGTPIARRLWINCVGIATFSCQVCALGLNLTGASDAVLNMTAPGATAYITFKNACNSLWGIGSSFIGRNCNLDVYNFSTNTNALTIDKTGVTCFASTVCTGGLVYAANGGCFKSAADARALFLKQNTVNSDNIIQFIDHNGTYAWEVVGRNSVFYIYNAAVSNFSMCINPSTNAVHFPGAVSKGSGTFNIEHPLDSKKCTHRLVHSFIEGPQADLIYRGKINLDNGIACVNIDCSARMTEGTFEALNRCAQVFTTNESSWDAIKGKLHGNILVIESQNTESNDEISWMVIGERQDKHIKDTSITDSLGRIITEPEVEEQFTCVCYQ